MATSEYKMGTPLGPDPEAVADLKAIDDYVRTQARPRVTQFPKSLPLVEDYEKWRQAVGYWDMMVMVNDTLRTAKAKRDQINGAQNQILPPDTTVEPGAFVASPPDTSSSTRLGRTVLVAALGAVGGVWAFRKLLGGRIDLGGHTL